MTKKRKVLACSGGVLSRAVQKEHAQWNVHTALSEVNVTCLTQDPSKPNRIFAGSDGDGLWISEDGGDNWELLSSNQLRFRSLAVSPHDANTILAGAKPALVYKSIDGGQSWQELEGFRRIPNRWWWFSPAEPPEWRAYISQISISPQDPNIVLAGVEFGAVVRSVDGGLSWSRHRRGSLRDCHSLKFHHSDGDVAYEAGAGGLSISHDSGDRWNKVNRGLAKRYGITCAADPTDPTIWYGCLGSSPYNAFGDDPKVYLYRRQADQWQPIGWQPHPLTETPSVLVTVPGEPGQLYAGLQHGSVMQSEDYGESWQRLPFELPGIWHHLLVI